MDQLVEIKSKIQINPSRVGKKYFVKTFGCQMNEHDSERISGMFELDGMSKAMSEEYADVLFVNTCTIRENADDKLYGTLGQLKQWKSQKDNRKLVVGGCAAQKDKELVREKAPWVDVVIGTHNLTNVVDLLNRSEDWGPLTEIIDEIETLPTEAPSIRESEYSAWVTIQIGCNNSCTFCIVPSVRGQEISRRPSDIVNEAKKLVDEGVKEITLLGQNVNSYGRDLKIDGKARPYFSQLLEQLNDIEGLERIRFTSPHPKDFREELAEGFAQLPSLCEQLHLPLQSGSDRVLRRMRRWYTLEKYLEKVALYRRYVPQGTLSTDMIVGFPGETEEDFEQTLQAIQTVHYDQIFAFKYSPRPDTPPAEYSGQLPEEVKIERLRRLLELQEPIVKAKNKALIGSSQEVLVEGPYLKDPNRLNGRVEVTIRLRLQTVPLNQEN